MCWLWTSRHRDGCSYRPGVVAGGRVVVVVGGGRLFADDDGGATVVAAAAGGCAVVVGVAVVGFDGSGDGCSARLRWVNRVGD